MKDNKTKTLLMLLIITSIIILFIGYLTTTDIINTPNGFLVLCYTIMQNFVVEGDTKAHQDSILILIGSFLAPVSLVSSIIFTLFEAGNKTLTKISIKLYYKNHIIVAGDSLDSQQLLSSNNETFDKKIIFIISEHNTVPNYIVENRNITVVTGEIESKKIWDDVCVSKSSSVILSLNNVVKAPYISDIILKSCKNKIPRIYLGLKNNQQNMVISDRKNMISENSVLKDKIKTFSMQSLSAISLIENNYLHKFYSIKALTDNRTHLVFYGFNALAERILLEALHSYIYPNKELVLISFIINNNELIDNFILTYPGFNNVAEYNTYSEYDFIDILRLKESNPFSIQPLQYFFFLEDSWLIPKLARNFRRFILNEYSEELVEVPFIFLLPDNEEYPAVHKSYITHYSELNIRVYEESDFVKINSIILNEYLIDSMAMNIHKSYQDLYDIEPWEELTEREKEFNRRSARHYDIKLAFLGYEIVDKLRDDDIKLRPITPDEIEVLAEMEHRRWLTEKYLDDFILFDKKNSTYKKLRKSLRLHTDLVHFDKLTQEDIDKDIGTFKNLEKTLNKVLKNKSIKITETNN